VTHWFFCTLYINNEYYFTVVMWLEGGWKAVSYVNLNWVKSDYFANSVRSKASRFTSVTRTGGIVFNLCAVQPDKNSL